MRGVYSVYLKSATTRGDSGTKTEVSHWKCFSLVVRRGLADSIDKKPQVAGLLFLQVLAERAFFVGYLGFRARIWLSTCIKRSRTTFVGHAPNLGNGMLEQFHQPGLFPLLLAPSVCWKSRLVGGGWLIGKRRLGCPSPFQAAQAYGAYYLE